VDLLPLPRDLLPILPDLLPRLRDLLPLLIDDPKPKVKCTTLPLSPIFLLGFDSG
jgi:hypothetical protein